MNAEQKQRAIQLITTWRTRSITTRPEESSVCGDCMTDILQELVDAPESEPVAWMVKNGFICSMIYRSKKDADNYAADQQKRHDISGSLASFCVIPLYTAPTPAEAPADVARWIDPNDKTQKQYLPHVGERVLFCHDGRTYYGKHTGGSFISFTHPGNTYPTWGCHWMYPPKATDAAMSEKGGA